MRTWISLLLYAVYYFRGFRVSDLFVEFSDYQQLDGQDTYEQVGLDDSLEDERDLDQIMADRNAAEAVLDERDTRNTVSDRKLPRALRDLGNCNYILNILIVSHLIYKLNCCFNFSFQCIFHSL